MVFEEEKIDQGILERWPGEKDRYDQRSGGDIMGWRKTWGAVIAAAAVCLCGVLMEGCRPGVELSDPGADEGICADEGRAAGEGADENTDENMDENTGEAPDIELTIRESPVDTERYDIRTDRIYKEAFLKAITGQAPIRYREGTVTYRELLPDGEGMEDEAFLKAVRQSDFFYQDYDDDGLPELIIDTEGPCVLKYHPEEDEVELYQQKEPGWRLLGAGQMYADLSGPADGYYVYLYHYESVGGRSGSPASYHWNSEDGYTCQVTIDGQEYTVTGEDAVTRLRQAYVRMIKDAPHPMTFAALFGDGGEQGYLPGEEPPPRYLLKETAALPINEESGEEWEAYKTMLEGDFSIVEDERWGGLQASYEDDLEEGDGRCSWSYLLMDFDQDGTKELLLRLYPDRVNTTAYFRYEDGHIKMWRTYMSADPHCYSLPLINGRVLVVEWYQDDRDWYIEGPDPRDWEIREKHYSKTKYTGSQELKEGDPEDHYTFQDYYHDGKICGALMDLSPEEWEQIEEMVEGLLILEEAWKPCSVFTPKEDRPEIPGVP